MTTMREQVSLAMSGTTGHHGDVLDAAMAVVAGVERERDQARASVEHLRGDYRRIRKDRDRLLLAWRSARRRANRLRFELHTLEDVMPCGECDDTGIMPGERAGRDEDGAPCCDVDGPCPQGCPVRPDIQVLMSEAQDAEAERDLAVWLHAEAVWQQDQLRVEAERQWTVRRQMGHRMIDADSGLTEAVDLARWLLAESTWRRVALWDLCKKIARSAMVQRCKSCHDDGKELAALRASTVELPKDWRQQIGLCESSGAAVDLVESWLPAAVEGGPADRIEWCVFYGGTDPYHSAGFELYDDEADATEHAQLYEQPAGVAKRTVRRGSWEITQAAGVSGTGTEASDVSR